jgi:hypothetical protein
MPYSNPSGLPHSGCRYQELEPVGGGSTAIEEPKIVPSHPGNHTASLAQGDKARRGREMLNADDPASNQPLPLGAPLSHEDVADLVEEPSAHDIRVPAEDERKAAVYRAAAEELERRRKEPSRIRTSPR